MFNANKGSKSPRNLKFPKVTHLSVDAHGVNIAHITGMSDNLHSLYIKFPRGDTVTEQNVAALQSMQNLKTVQIEITAHSMTLQTVFNLCRMFTAATNLQFVLRTLNFNHDSHFLEILSYFQQTSVNYSLLTDKCQSLPHLLAFEIHNKFLENSEFEKMCKSLPWNLQELTLDVVLNDSVLTDYQVSVLSDTLKELHNLTSLALPTHISENSLKILVETLKSNENLRYLALTLSADTNACVESLTQLTNLHHLILKFKWPGPLPQTFKHPLIKIIRNLTELRSIQVDQCISWSEKDIMKVIQETRHLTHHPWFNIKLCNNDSQVSYTGSLKLDFSLKLSFLLLLCCLWMIFALARLCPTQ